MSVFVEKKSHIDGRKNICFGKRKIFSFGRRKNVSVGKRKIFNFGRRKNVSVNSGNGIVGRRKNGKICSNQIVLDYLKTSVDKLFFCRGPHLFLPRDRINVDIYIATGTTIHNVMKI